MKYCSNCGAELHDDAQFCTKCGKSLSKDSENINTRKEPKVNKKAIYAFLVVIGVLLMIVFGAMYYSDYSEKEEDRLAREKFVADSLEQARKDSIKLAELKEKARQDSISNYKKMHDSSTILARVKDIFGNDDFFSEEYKSILKKLYEVGEKHFPGDIVGPDYNVWDTSQGGCGEGKTIFGKVYDIHEKTAKIKVINDFGCGDDHNVVLTLVLENDNWFVDDISNCFSKSLKSDMKQEIKSIEKG